MPVVVKDLGLNRITQDMKELRGVKVGLLEGAAPYPDGTNVVDVGIYNEYGTSRIPSRPFMRVAADQAEREMHAYTEHMVGLLIDGRTNAKGVDDSVGNAMKDVIQKTITGFNKPPNAPSTVKAKGRNDPLVDTGHMRDSINYERL